MMQTLSRETNVYACRFVRIILYNKPHRGIRYDNGPFRRIKLENEPFCGIMVHSPTFRKTGPTNKPFLGTTRANVPFPGIYLD